MEDGQLRGHLDLLLLATLAAGDGHGYELGRRLKARSEGLFAPAAGTMYPALRRLESDRLVSSRWREVGGRRRRVYSLTAPGRAALAHKRGRWERFAAGVTRILSGAGAPEA